MVRRPIPEDPVEAQQLTLFKDRKYAYHVLVTNMKTTPWRVWQFYAKRATIEKNIRELLYDYPLGKIPAEDWIANVAFMNLQVTHEITSSIFKGFRGKNTIFTHY